MKILPRIQTISAIREHDRLDPVAHYLATSVDPAHLEQALQQANSRRRTKGQSILDARSRHVSRRASGPRYERQCLARSQSGTPPGPISPTPANQPTLFADGRPRAQPTPAAGPAAAGLRSRCGVCGRSRRPGPGCARRPPARTMTAVCRFAWLSPGRSSAADRPECAAAARRVTVDQSAGLSVARRGAGGRLPSLSGTLAAGLPCQRDRGGMCSPFMTKESVSMIAALPMVTP